MHASPGVAKTIWTEADFANMGWHDNTIHAMAFEPSPPHPGRLLIDLDYIVDWVPPSSPAETYRWWICPATLVFDPAWDLTANINLQQISFTLSLDVIIPPDPASGSNSRWTLRGHDFELSFGANGFTQYLRHPPILSDCQGLAVDERGGLSLDQRGYTL